MMTPISSQDLWSVRPLLADAPEQPRALRREEQTQSGPPAQNADAPAPGLTPEPTGLYRPVREADGRRSVRFDAPRQTEPNFGAPKEAPEPPRTERSAQRDAAPGAPEEDAEERWRCDTDAVDREIKALRERAQQLRAQARAQTDPAARRRLEQQLAQTERSLREKDNDAYRRERAVFTRLF